MSSEDGKVSVSTASDSSTINISDDSSDSHYGYVRVELFRATIALIAVIGSIYLGTRNPNTFGASAMTTLGVAVGGYFGVQQQRKQ